MEDITRLLLRARDGDREALAAWVARAQPDVWRFVAASVGVDRADDVTQDVFLRAIRSMSSFRGEATSRTWVLAIARHAIVDEHRRTGRRRALRDRLGRQPGTVWQQPDDLATRHTLHDAIGQLDLYRREAFVLTQMLGLGYAEAAEVLDIPVGTVRSRIARARQDLMADLGDEARLA